MLTHSMFMPVQTFLVSETPISEHYSHNKFASALHEKKWPRAILSVFRPAAIALFFSGIYNLKKSKKK